MKKFLFSKQLLIAAVAAVALLAIACTKDSNPATSTTAPATVASGAVSTGPTTQPSTGSGSSAVLGSLAGISMRPSGPPAVDYTQNFGGVYQAGNTQTGIVVTGIGSKTLQPDVATVSVGVESREKTVSAAREAAAKAMTQVRDAVRALGVADKDFVTTYFNIQPETVWVEVKDNVGTHGKPEIIGYIVTNQAEVNVRKIDDVGKIIDAVAEKGGDLIRINGVSFTVGDPSAYAVSLRQLAAQDARAKAQVYADAMGVKLGQLVFLTEQSSSAPVLQKQQEMRAMAADSFTPTPITPGESELTTTITAVFAIGQ